MWCATCGAPVFRSGNAWFHDIYPRWLATICRDVTKTPLAARPEKALPDLARL
jgi:hypothetical protein